MRNILVATDLTGDSENAVIRAIQLSKLSGTTLHVLHVTRSIQVGKPDEAALFHAEIRDRIRGLIGQHAASSDIDYEAHIENGGRVYEKVIEYAREVGADLVVIGRSARPDVLPGSVFLTTGHIITHSPVPVLVVTQPVSGNYGHILLETHLSISPKAVLTPARDFGPDIQLTLLIDSGFECQESAGIVQRLIAALRRRKHEKYMARAATLLKERGLSENRVSLDIVKHDYEAVLLSKLKDDEIDVVGLVRTHQKLRDQDSRINILAELQAASCDMLAKSESL